MVLSWNPCILTLLYNIVRQQICRYFSNHGHVVLPAADDAIHMITGHPKPIPTPTFIAALREAGVHYIRIINFGMKQPLNVLPPLPRDLLLCQATNNGYPENKYDVSVSHHHPFLYLVKPIAPFPPNITVNQFPILTPLTLNCRRSLGGNITIVVDDPEQVLSMKGYTLQFHLLRACNPNPITSPVTTRQGASLFDTLNGIMHVLSTHQQLVGGIRLEIRIRMTHVLDAVNHVLERQQFDPHQFGVNCQYNKVPVQRYLVYAEGLFRTARVIFTRSGVMRHAGAREMTNMEKRIFGDLKLLLGCRHCGYRTVPGKKTSSSLRLTLCHFQLSACIQ